MSERGRGFPLPKIEDALQMYNGQQFRSKEGGGGENQNEALSYPSRGLGVGKIAFENHGAMRLRESVPLAGNSSL